MKKNAFFKLWPNRNFGELNEIIQNENKKIHGIDLAEQKAKNELKVVDDQIAG